VIYGLVLAGGRSRRFGADKALATLGDRSLLDAALTVLAGGCAQVAVNAREGSVADLVAARGLDRIADPPGAPDGPLAGVLAGLMWARAAGADLLATAPCDTPFLPADLVARLAEGLEADDGLAFARAPDGVHPLCGLWRVRLIEPLRTMLAEVRHPPARAAVGDLGGRAVDFPDAAAFFNVNTLQDLAGAAQALISRGERPIAGRDDDVKRHG
jgi:molybdopterin-guanine dinucleotide biosynthesis protein A